MINQMGQDWNMSAKGTCLYCGQLLKDLVASFHNPCKGFYFRKAERALVLARLDEFPELNLVRGNHLEKTKVCRNCLYPVSDEDVRRMKTLVAKTNLKGANGFCPKCVKLKKVEEDNLKEQGRQFEDKGVEK